MINIDRTAEQNDILLTLDATDTSGLNGASFSFRRLNEKGEYDWEQNSTTHVNISEWNSLISGGSIFDGSYVGLVAPSASTKAGKYVLSHFSISDKADNRKYFNATTSTSNGNTTYSWSTEAKKALGNNNLSSFSFTIIGDNSKDNDIDSKIPLIKNLSLSKQKRSQSIIIIHLLLKILPIST